MHALLLLLVAAACECTRALSRSFDNATSQPYKQRALQPSSKSAMRARAILAHGIHRAQARNKDGLSAATATLLCARLALSSAATSTLSA